VTPKAWLVVAADGFESVFLDHARALQYAAHVHGTVSPLYLHA
jgi:hypothetical protein